MEIQQFPCGWEKLLSNLIYKYISHSDTTISMWKYGNCSYHTGDAKISMWKYGNCSYITDKARISMWNYYLAISLDKYRDHSETTISMWSIWFDSSWSPTNYSTLTKIEFKILL